MEKKSISNYATCLTVNCYNIPIKQQQKKAEKDISTTFMQFLSQNTFQCTKWHKK